MPNFSFFSIFAPFGTCDLQFPTLTRHSKNTFCRRLAAGICGSRLPSPSAYGTPNFSPSIGRCLPPALCASGSRRPPPSVFSCFFFLAFFTSPGAYCVIFLFSGSFVLKPSFLIFVVHFSRFSPNVRLDVDTARLRLFSSHNLAMPHLPSDLGGSLKIQKCRWCALALFFSFFLFSLQFCSPSGCFFLRVFFWPHPGPVGPLPSNVPLSVFLARSVLPSPRHPPPRHSNPSNPPLGAILPFVFLSMKNLSSVTVCFFFG